MKKCHQSSANKPPNLPSGRFRNLPNMLSLTRIFLLLPLGYLAWTAQRTPFGIVLVLFWLTDFFDGTLARMLKASSSLGAELDSIADTLGGIFITIYLYLFLPKVFVEVMPWLAFVAALGTTYLLLSYWKLRRIGLHFYSAKFLGFMTFVFQTYTVFADFSPTLFYLWVFSFTLAMIEQIIALMTGNPTYRTKSLLEILKKKRQCPEGLGKRNGFSA
jgi:CDP-diacylglycerol--glycerol-3-phosphate 3-phosphatidyltransferase